MPDLFDQINSPDSEREPAQEPELQPPAEENRVLAETPVEEGGEEVIEGDTESEAEDEPKADDAEDVNDLQAAELDTQIAKDASKPAEKKTEPSNTVNVVEEDPYDFDKCLISIGIGLMPDDGNPDGRPVMLGVRNHQDEPIVRMVRLNDLLPLPDPIQQLLDQLKDELPARSEKTAAKKKKAEAAKNRSNVAVGKTVSPVKKAEKPRPANMNLFDMFDLNP
jgi:hypothetical protein